MLDFDTHDVIQFEAGGNIVDAVVKGVDDDALTANVPRGTKHFESEDVWIEGGTAYVAPDRAEKVGSPDTENIHPNDFRVDAHFDLLDE